MQPSPTVSIIMPCYNAEQHLPTSVGSVLAQTFTDWELIAVDDGSGDDTLQWLRAQTDPRIRVHTQANQGVSAARNAGLSLARGQYVAFLDADDTWSSCFLEDMKTALDANSGNVLAYCGWQNLGLPGGRGEPFIPIDYETANKDVALFASCRWPIHAALVKRDAITAAGGFDVHLKNAEDFALWLEIATGAPIVRVAKVLAYYHFHEGTQASANRGRAALHHLKAQVGYLARHPEFGRRLGKTRVRKLLYGELLNRGYECYWDGDLSAARLIFRVTMKHCYGTLKDWKYMLPTLLPVSWHRQLITFVEKLKIKALMHH